MVPLMIAAACRMVKNLDLGCRRVDAFFVIGVLLILSCDLGKPVSLLAHVSIAFVADLH